MAVNSRISVNLHGLDRKLKGMEKGTKHFQKPLKKSGVYMEQSIGKRFKRAPWKPLSSSTIRIHPHRAGGKPLNDTGKLRMSVTSQAVKKVSSKQLTYGTNLIYAPIHNFGGRAGWGKVIPKREFLYFDDTDERAIEKIFVSYIKELSR